MNKKIMEIMNKTEMDQKKFVCFGLKTGILIALILAAIWHTASKYKSIIFFLSAVLKNPVRGFIFLFFTVVWILAFAAIIPLIILALGLIYEGFFGPIHGPGKEKF